MDECLYVTVIVIIITIIIPTTTICYLQESQQLLITIPLNTGNMQAGVCERREDLD